MKKKELIGLKEKTIDGLKKVLVEKKSEIDKKFMERVSGNDKNLRAVGNLKKDVAKILTVIREKEIIEEFQKKMKKGAK